VNPDAVQEQTQSGYTISDSDGSGVTVHLQEAIDVSNATQLAKNILSRLKKRRPQELTVDLEKVPRLDDFGILVLVELKRYMLEREGRFRFAHANDSVAQMLDIFHFETLGQPVSFAKERSPGALTRLGSAVLDQLSETRYLVTFLGSVFMAMVYTLFHPRSLRGDDTLTVMQKTGVDALPIVGLISFLLGLIMAFMSAVQLQQFGANIYVASLVSLSMVRELGPIMTAIIVAGRSGSSFAAEIGTMKISEEVDALYTMGFDTIRFLVVPKIVASVIVVPLLTLFSNIFAILGGLLVGVSMLDLTINAYVAQTIKTLTLFDVIWGLFKSGVFALLIAWIGCLRGFQVRGGAASVGQATTSAVVSSIFLIILTDSVLAVILRYWG